MSSKSREYALLRGRRDAYLDIAKELFFRYDLSGAEFCLREAMKKTKRFGESVEPIRDRIREVGRGLLFDMAVVEAGL
ncbi:MAG: hypothetical protein KKE05_05485 [Nanoarchaeota archaeon]|nr:hypothetical protein [Nanoarchaeota archaeon]